MAIRFTCPHCCAVALLDTARPALRLDGSGLEAVLRLEPFQVPCGVCGRPVSPPVPAIFAGDGFAVRLLAAGFEAPDAPQGVPVLRDTEDLLSFREKVLLLTAGYDDRAVELLKLMTEEANEGALTGLVALDATDEDIVFSAADDKGAEILFRSPRALHDRLASHLPGPSDTEFVRVDRSWASSRLKACPPQAK